MAQHTARTTENQENGYAPQAGYQHISPAVFLSPVLLALALRPLGIGLPWLTAVPSTLTILLTLVTCSFFWFRHLVSLFSSILLPLAQHIIILTNSHHMLCHIDFRNTWLFGNTMQQQLPGSNNCLAVRTNLILSSHQDFVHILTWNRRKKAV